MHARFLFIVLIFLLLAVPTLAGFYDKDSAVINLTPKTFNKEIANTNYTSIVEFYAEWCGHCKNLRPQYIKAAKSLNGLVKVAAVRCDDKANDALCSKYQVKSYPTLKIFKPNPKTPKTPMIENYQGQRTAKSIVDTLLGRISNKVKRLKAADISSWIDESDTPHVLLFTNKANTPPMYKALALDFVGTASFGVIKSSEKSAVKEYGVTTYPTVFVLTKNNGVLTKELYTGPHTKESLYLYVSEFAAPVEGPRAGKAPSRSKTMHEDL